MTCFTLPRWTAAVAACTLSATVWAAGGHHAVDDAEILDPGACELETWYERSGAPRRLAHLGAGCRVGPVELGAASEYEREDGTSATGHGLQVKWATEIAKGLRLGAAVSPSWQARERPRFQGTVGLALLTWEASDTVRLHANLGRDFAHRASDEDRGGVSADWAFATGWTVMAERYRQEGGHFARAGLRWQPAEGWTLDLSRAVRVRGEGSNSWTAGLTYEFDR